MENNNLSDASLESVAGGYSSVRTVVITDACVGCGCCIIKCPIDVIYLDGRKAVVTPGACVGCGSCINSCPTNAIIEE